MKKVKLKVKILASMALVSMTIAGGTLYVTNAKQYRNINENSIELNVEKQDRDTVKIYLSNFGDLAKSLQLSVKIDKGNVKFEKDSIKWLVGSGNNDENESDSIQTNYKIDSSGKVLDLFIVSKEALNSDGGKIELCEIDVSKDESILDKIFKSNDGTYTIAPNVVDGEAYSYVIYSTNKRVAGENIVNPSNDKLSIKDEPVIRFKDTSSVVDNQIIISKGTVFNINDYVEAFDADGNKIEKIEYTGKVDNKKAGSYNIVCTAIDSSGITTKLETVVVVEQFTNEDISQPVIYGTENPIEIFIGGEFDFEKGITAEDYMGRNLKLSISGEYDINVPGVYTIIYSATDRFNNTVTAERKLIVNEKIEEDDSEPEQPDDSGSNKPTVPDGSGDKDFTIPEIIESIVDTEGFTTIGGEGTSTSPLLVQVKDVSSEQLVKFLNSINEKGLEVKEGKVKEDDTYKTLMLKLGKKSSKTAKIDNSDLEKEYYISIRVDKSKTELLNNLNSYIQQNNFPTIDTNNDGNNNNNNNSNSGGSGSSNNNSSGSSSNNSNSNSGNNDSETLEDNSTSEDLNNSDNSTDANNIPSQDSTNNSGEVSVENSFGGSFIDKITNTITNIFNGSNNNQESSNTVVDQKADNNYSNNLRAEEQVSDENYENNLDDISDEDGKADDENAVDLDNEGTKEENTVNEDSKGNEEVLELQYDSESSSEDKKIGLIYMFSAILTLTVAAVSTFYFKNKKK